MEDCLGIYEVFCGDEEDGSCGLGLNFFLVYVFVRLISCSLVSK